MKTKLPKDTLAVRFMIAVDCCLIMFNTLVFVAVSSSLRWAFFIVAVFVTIGLWIDLFRLSTFKDEKGN